MRTSRSSMFGGILMRRDRLARLYSCVGVMRIYPPRPTSCMSRMVFLPVCVSHFCSVVDFSADFVSYICLRNTGKSYRTRGPQQEWARKADLFRGQGAAEERPLILGAVAKVLGVYPTPPPKPYLPDAWLYLDFFPGTLDFAVYPHKPRHAS